MLQEKVKAQIEAHFINLLGLKPAPNGWYRGDCPGCGSKYTFGVNMEQNRANCFKACGINKNPVNLLIKLKGLTNYQELRVALGSTEGWDYFPTKLEKTPEKPKQTLKLPEHYKSILVGDSLVAQAARAYLKGRGFDLTELALRGIGYAGQGEYLGYIIIPYYYGGELVYYNARRFIGDKTFKNPDIDTFGIGRNELVYNIDALAMYSEVTIVESATNSLTIGDDSVALGGKVLSGWQFNTFIKAPVETYNVMLDYGAYSEALELAMKLSRYKKVRVIELLTEDDANDLGRGVSRWLIRHATEMNYRQLYKEKLAL
jgi:hypothetical protein